MIRRMGIIICMLLVAAAPAQKAALAGPSVERMAGAMIMTGFRGTMPPESLLRAIRAGHVGSVILFDRDKKQGDPRNIESPAQVKALTSALQKAAGGRLLIAVDQEGGKVSRLKAKRGFFPLPSAREMGGMEQGRVRDLGRKAGEEMRSLGINVDLAPVVDLQRSSISPGLGDMGRLFGSAPRQTARHALAFAEGLQKSGVIPVLKHFPGLGSASRDSHLDLPDVTRSWSREELEPYAMAFAKGWHGMVLVAHVYNGRLDPALPSSLSGRVVNDLLRTEMGWNGVVVSDDLQMGAVARTYGIKEMIRLAVLAGCDILLFGNNLDYHADLHERAFNAMMELVREGSISAGRLMQSWRRIEKAKSRLFAGDNR
ncbi:MAG: glycoside hydrolase family 3 protein [Mailhella sp.]|nr:glycoside hydrolase family 3 protein [Mailhella sp.]